MLNRTRSIGMLASGLVLMSSIASAQLQLTGRTTGYFDDLNEANTTVTNSSDGSWATFETGIPRPGSTQSSIRFENAEFSNIGSGDALQVGLFDITNGVTELNSGAPIGRFNVGLELTGPEAQTVALSTILFHIDHTPNQPERVPDMFAVSVDQPGPVKIGDTLLRFHVNLEPAEFLLAENATTQRGDITVSFTPVPEPSTYALAGIALLVGAIAFRRLRGSKVSSGLLPSA